MARHRIVRTMDYNDEYDGYDDVYGHSVDDEASISPTDASQWIYDRARGQQSISAFMKNNRDIEEEDEDIGESRKNRRDSETCQLPPLDDIEQAKLTSCIDEVRSVVGDATSENTIIKFALQYNFDVAKTLDSILNEDQEPKPEKKLEKALANLDILPRSSERIDKGYKNIIPAVVTTVVAVKDANIKKGFNLKQPSSSGLGLDRKSPESSQFDVGNKLSAKLPKEIDHKNNRELYLKERANVKEHLHMVVIGHVDAGKSTLMGHMLYDTGNISERVMHKYEHESKKIGKQSFAYAWVLDETGEERSRGITMDVGSSRIETATKIITLLDAPGHKDFIPNMISGAAQADVALLVVDATRGEFETGFEQGGQTREHTLLVRSLGVGQIGVVVNKLDTVDWSENRFNEIVLKLKPFFKHAGLKETEVTFIPCSGLTGENLVHESKEPNLIKWYKGPSLMNVIDAFKVPERSIEKPFRMSVIDIFKGTGSNFCVSGRVETGILNVTDKVLISPSREQAHVKSIAIDEVTQQTVFAGDQILLTLSGVDINNVFIGNIICDPQFPIPVTSRIQARILVFNIKTPLTIGFPVLLHHQSLIESAHIFKLVSLLNKSTGDVIKKKPRFLENNSCALVDIQTAKPISVEKYADCKELGRVMLRVNGVTIAVGLVTQIS